MDVEARAEVLHPRDGQPVERLGALEILVGVAIAGVEDFGQGDELRPVLRGLRDQPFGARQPIGCGAGVTSSCTMATLSVRDMLLQR